MEPGHPLETLHGEADHDGVCVTSWVSVCPRGLWKVQRKRIHSGVQQTASDSAFSSINCPRLGSLCRVRVHLKSNADEAESLACETRGEKLAAQPALSVADVIESGATPFVRCKDSVLQVPLGDWTTLRLGDGQCDITEACLEGMRAGEMCEIQLSPMETGPDVPHPSDEGLPLCATVELQAFTPGKESWEMSPSEKWERVKSHKETGGVRFRSEDLWGAADSYSKAIKLVITLYNHIRDVQKKRCEYEAEEQRDPNATVEKLHPSAEELSTMKAELHSNLSLCQLKLNQPEWAKANAAKATQLEPGCAKAWYRLGKACQIVNELEEAKRAYRKLLELQPEMPAALKALKEIASREKETNAQLGLRLSKMFS